MRDLQINARPHNNGNTPESFRKAGRAINAAAMDCAAILNAHASEVFNGRNYQHDVTPVSSRAADLASLETIREALRLMETMGIAVFMAGKE